MVGRVTTLFFGHDDRTTLGPHQNLVLGLLKVFHIHQTAITTRCEEGCFVDQVGKIGAGHARGSARKDIGLDVRRHRHLTHVHRKNLLAAAHIGQWYHHLTVKPARTQQRGVKHVRAVGGRDHDDALVGLKTIHFHEHLVQGLLTLVVTTT